MFKLRSVVKHEFMWMRVYPKTGVVKELANTCRLFIYVLIITARNLIEVVCWYIDNFEPACGGVDCLHAGETNIIFNDITFQLMLSYRITIWIYQVHMHQIP